MPRYAYVNGRYIPHQQAGVSIEDRGFLFADSIYEVVMLVDGMLGDETGHMDRLERSMKELQIKPPMSRKSLGIVLREVVRRNGIKNGMVYLQVTRGAAKRDFAFPKKAKTTLVVMLYPLNYDRDKRKASVKKVITYPDIRWKRVDIKTTAMTGPVMAKQAAAEKGAIEAWLVDDDGYVTEGAASNAWIVDKNNNLITRPTSNNKILKGVTRNSLQAICKKEGLKVIERAFTVKEAYAAKEAFCSSATALIMPVVQIDDKKIGDGKTAGAITCRVFDLYMDYATDPARKQERWDPK